MAPNSCVPIGTLTPDRLAERIKNLKRVNKSLKEKVHRRDLKLKEANFGNRALLNGDNVLRIVKDAYNFCTTGEGKKKLVASMLSTMMREDVNKQRWNEDQVNDFVDRFSNSMKNKINMMNDKSHNNSFDSRVLRIAFSNWLEHGQSAYNRLQEENLEIFPDIRTMQRHYASNYAG